MTKNSSPAAKTHNPRSAPASDNHASVPAKVPSKLDQVEAMLKRPEGASIAELTQATGWQQHSVRGAMAGALKKRGLAIASEMVDGIRRYRAGAA